MDGAAIGRVCLALPGAALDYPFGPDAAVYKVGGKMFAMASAGHGLSFKTSDMAYEVLTENGLARPAPYMARAKWVNLPDPSDWAEAEVAEHLKAAYEIVRDKLPKKLRLELGLY